MNIKKKKVKNYYTDVIKLNTFRHIETTSFILIEIGTYHYNNI